MVRILTREDIRQDVISLTVAHDGMDYNVIVVWDDVNGISSFYYRNGEKPEDTDFEQDVMCAL